MLGGIAGDAEAGPLTAAWQASPQSDLGDLMKASPALRKALDAKFGKANLDELVALSQESDTELFWESALRLAHRLESQGRIDPSLALLRIISQGVGSGYLDMRRAADRGAEVLLGHGEFGDRFEFMLRKVTHELSDPWAITAFGAGSLAFRAAKLGAMSRLWASSAREYLPGRVAAEWIATGAGISVEAPVFVATSKLAHQFSGVHQDWRGASLAKEVAGVGITLVGLRGTGALGEKAVQNLYFSKIAQKVTPQAATLGGILLAHRAEEHLQLRPATNGSTFLADGLTTFFQFAVGGRLADAALGAGFRTWQRQMDWRVASLSGRSGGGLGSPALTAAGAGAGFSRVAPSVL
ncbi:MAG TPA: hypothetical protein VJP40_07010, partial [bacterium]|nr:hypothetical protein [bacterium]